MNTSSLFDYSLCPTHQGRFNAEMHDFLFSAGYRGEDFIEWIEQQPLGTVMDIISRGRRVVEWLRAMEPCDACNVLTTISTGARL